MASIPAPAFLSGSRQRPQRKTAQTLAPTSAPRAASVMAANVPGCGKDMAPIQKPMTAPPASAMARGSATTCDEQACRQGQQEQWQFGMGNVEAEPCGAEASQRRNREGLPRPFGDALVNAKHKAIPQSASNRPERTRPTGRHRRTPPCPCSSNAPKRRRGWIARTQRTAPGGEICSSDPGKEGHAGESNRSAARPHGH